MKNRSLSFHSLLLLCLTPLYAGAQWQQQTPMSITRSIPATGEWVEFTDFSLPIGMQYYVITSGTAAVGAGGEKVDGAFYISNIGPPLLSSNLFATGVQTVNLQSNVNFFLSTGGFNSAYRADHEYAIWLGSLDSQKHPRFRIFDRAEPGSTPDYYRDNSGAVEIHLVQKTPRLSLEKNSLAFDTIFTDETRDLQVRVASYGVDSLKISTIELVSDPKDLPGFQLSSERGWKSAQYRYADIALADADSNSINVTFLPRNTTHVGLHTATLRIVSTNAWHEDSIREITITGFSKPAQSTVSEGPQSVPLSVWPNPTSGTLHISGTEHATIYDLLGNQIAIARRGTDLDVSTLTPGTYIVSDQKQRVKLQVK